MIGIKNGTTTRLKLSRVYIPNDENYQLDAIISGKIYIDAPLHI